LRTPPARPVAPPLSLHDALPISPLTLARAEVATTAAVLGDVTLVAEPAQLKGRRYGNLVVVGPHTREPDPAALDRALRRLAEVADRKSTRLNSSHVKISYAVFCL